MTWRVDEPEDLGDDDDFNEEWYCTWCMGDGLEENDDPIERGPGEFLPCGACNGTGLRKHQTIF